MGQLESDSYCESVYCGGIRLILTNGTRATGAQDVWPCLIKMLNRILQSIIHYPSWSHLSMDRAHSQIDFGHRVQPSLDHIIVLAIWVTWRENCRSNLSPVAWTGHPTLSSPHVDKLTEIPNKQINTYNSS